MSPNKSEENQVKSYSSTNLDESQRQKKIDLKKFKKIQKKNSKKKEQNHVLSTHEAQGNGGLADTSTTDHDEGELVSHLQRKRKEIMRKTISKFAPSKILWRCRQEGRQDRREGEGEKGGEHEEGEERAMWPCFGSGKRIF